MSARKRRGAPPANVVRLDDYRPGAPPQRPTWQEAEAKATEMSARMGLEVKVGVEMLAYRVIQESARRGVRMRTDGSPLQLAILYLMDLTDAAEPRDAATPPG